MAMEEVDTLYEQLGPEPMVPLRVLASKDEAVHMRRLADTDDVAHTYTPPVRYAGEVLAENQDELAWGLETWLTIHGVHKNAPQVFESNLKHLAEYSTHELAHAERSRQLGLTAVYFGLVFVRDANTATFLPFATFGNPTRPVTKIQHASILVAPKVPSDLDIESVQLIGYQDKADVLRRLAASPDR
jgi:hypothetical protein